MYLLLTNSYKEFWLWAVQYPLSEWSNYPGYVALEITRKELFTFLILFSPLVFTAFKFKVFKQNHFFLLSIAFLLSAVITVYPRFSLFHFQPALAFLFITISIIFTYLNKKLRTIYLGYLIIITFLVIYLVPKNISGETRFYSLEEKVVIDKMLAEVKPNETIFLLGLNPSYYVFTNTVPPKLWSDNFGWYLEIPGVQKWVLSGFYNSLPEIIYRRVPSLGRWYDLGSYQPQEILRYMNDHYFLDGYLSDGIERWSKK